MARPKGHDCAPPICVLGRGAGKLIPFHDGIGAFNVLDILLETGDDGVLYPLDFTKPDSRVGSSKSSRNT